MPSPLAQFEIDHPVLPPRPAIQAPVVTARVGTKELALLDHFAYELGLTRSKLMRRLLAKSLRELDAQAS